MGAEPSGPSVRDLSRPDADVRVDIGAVGSLAAVSPRSTASRKSDRVAIASANRVEYVLSFWAATVLGAVTVALNGWWTGR